jgi:hypothetical protein
MRAIVRDTYGSPDVLDLPHQALGFLGQAYGITQQKDLVTRHQLGARTPCASLIDEVGDRMIGDGPAWKKRQECSLSTGRSNAEWNQGLAHAHLSRVKTREQRIVLEEDSARSACRKIWEVSEKYLPVW